MDYTPNQIACTAQAYGFILAADTEARESGRKRGILRHMLDNGIAYYGNTLEGMGIDLASLPHKALPPALEVTCPHCEATQGKPCGHWWGAVWITHKNPHAERVAVAELLI